MRTDSWSIPNGTWAQFRQLQELVESNECGRVSLFEWLLEIMTVSKRHEELKTRLEHLLGAYFIHLDIEFFGYGKATIETEPKERGRQPDISFWL